MPDAGGVTGLAQVLDATGPYGFVAVLFYLFVKVTERKDRELKAMTEKLMALTEAQTTAIVKVESALIALRAAIKDLQQSRSAGTRNADERT